MKMMAFGGHVINLSRADSGQAILNRIHKVHGGPYRRVVHVAPHSWQIPIGTPKAIFLVMGFGKL